MKQALEPPWVTANRTPYPQPLMLNHAQTQSTHSQQLNWFYPPHRLSPSSPMQPPHLHSQNSPSSQTPPPWPSRAPPLPPPLTHWGHPAAAPHHFPATVKTSVPPTGTFDAPPPYCTNAYSLAGKISNAPPFYASVPLQVGSASMSPTPTRAPNFCPQIVHGGGGGGSPSTWPPFQDPC